MVFKKTSKLLLLWGLVSGALPALAFENCPVEFEFDTSHATLLLDILEDNELTDSELDAFLGHPVTQDVLRKTRSYGLEVDKSSLAIQIRMLAAQQEITDSSFGLARYNARRAGTRSLVNNLESDFPQIHQSICDRIGPYVPAGGSYRQVVVLLSAVNSTGFTFDDPGRIFLVAEAFDGDLYGLGDLVVHESYHAVQSALTENNPLYGEAPGLPETTANSVIRLMAGTVLEGTATHIADPIEAGSEGAMRAFQYRLARRYRRDMQHQFTLFDTTLFRAHGDPDVEYYDLHRIGLEGNEAFYHLGALMTKTIAKADGPGSIPSYFQRSPVEFFNRYVALSKENTELPQFSESTRNILRKLSLPTDP